MPESPDRLTANLFFPQRETLMKVGERLYPLAGKMEKHAMMRGLRGQDSLRFVCVR
jgi:hypothetical protein